jgi:hypothetical protein
MTRSFVVHETRFAHVFMFEARTGTGCLPCGIIVAT